MRRRETLDRTFVFFTANCGYTSIEVSVFQTTKTVFEKERSMLTFGTKKQRPYQWMVWWSDVGKGLTVFPDFSLSTINDRVNLLLSFSFSVIPFCNVCLSKQYFGFLCFFLIASILHFSPCPRLLCITRVFFFYVLCFYVFFFYYYFNCFFFNIHTQWLSNGVTLAKQYNVSLF